MLFDQVIQLQRILAELSDRERRPVDRKRRDDGIDARPVRKPGIHHGRRLIDAAPDARDDPLDDLLQMGIVLESDGRQFETAIALDEDLLVTIHEDVVDGLIRQQRLQRPQPQHLVQNVLCDLCQFPLIERD